jgi:hypothetical protein
MKKRPLVESLDMLQEELLAEYDFMAGPGMIDRPEAAGDKNYNTLRGASKNFQSFDDNGSAWPYEDDGEVSLGIPSWEGGKGAWGRGDRPGSDVSGGPPTPRYQSTWAGGPDEVEEGADWDELQRHNEPVRNVWRDTPDGKRWSEMNNEAMGVPFQTGAVAPMDGPSLSSARDARPVEDENGDPISPEHIPPKVKDMSGPGNMWGGPGTVPGATMGWANMPPRPEDENDPEKNPMKLREFFDPTPVPPGEIENLGQDYFKDQTDEELEPDIEPEGMGIDDPDSFSGRLGGTSIFVMPKLGPGGEFVSSPDGRGSARGTYGLHSDGKQAGDMVDKRSAWDILQQVISNMAGPTQKNDREPEQDV